MYMYMYMYMYRASDKMQHLKLMVFPDLPLVLPIAAYMRHRGIQCIVFGEAGA